MRQQEGARLRSSSECDLSRVQVISQGGWGVGRSFLSYRALPMGCSVQDMVKGLLYAHPQPLRIQEVRGQGGLSRGTLARWSWESIIFCSFVVLSRRQGHQALGPPCSQYMGVQRSRQLTLDSRNFCVHIYFPGLTNCIWNRSGSHLCCFLALSP